MLYKWCYSCPLCALSDAGAAMPAGDVVDVLVQYSNCTAFGGNPSGFT